MKHLYYCRHGLSLMNKQGLLAGITDTPLVDEGREQARQAGVQAQQYQFDLIVTSPLIRSYETAEIIAREIGYPPEKIVANPLLAERDFGKLEGAVWHPGIGFSDEPSAEPYEHIMQRAREAKAWLEALPDQNVLLVSHGAFIRALRSLYQPDMPFADATATMPNAEIIQLT